MISAKDAYDKALRQATAELIKAIQQRDHWTLEVARLQQLVKALKITAATSQKDEEDAARLPDEVGLQEVIFTCVRASRFPLTAVGIKRQLESVGYDLSRYANAMAVIHSALKRLASAHKIKDAGGGAYVVSPLWTALSNV